MTDSKIIPGKFADSNVVSLDTRRDSTTVNDDDTATDFEAIQKRNLERQNRLTAERKKANEAVKRSYRLTPKR